MNKPAIKSLQQRLVLFLLIPVALLLFGMGFLGFIFARNIMLDQWREAAILKLERAAHHIDMRLNDPMERVNMFHETGSMGQGYATQRWILDQLKQLEGVASVDLDWADGIGGQRPGPRRGKGTGPMVEGRRPAGERARMMRFHRARISQVTLPHYDAQTGEKTVSLISRLKDEDDNVVGRLEVTLYFEHLMQDIRELGWWQSDTAYLVDDAGRFLARAAPARVARTRLGETNEQLEIQVLEELHRKPFGTIRGQGHPPEQVAGFYRMEKAPWAIVLFAPGEKILAPIIRFRFYYFIAGGVAILAIVLLIRSVAGGMAASITTISQAAEQVAKGEYEEPLPVDSEDELGQLTRGFNAMVEGLKERDFIRNTFGRYVDEEIARELMQKPQAADLGGKKRAVAILMSDLRNFTPLSETLTPEETISILNHYFSHMIDIIRKHRGIIVDFFGDALLVFFDPLDQPVGPSVSDAVFCALEMQEDIRNFNLESAGRGGPKLHMGIGVNAGDVVVGNIGSPSRAKYGIVGAPVNITQRIQSAADVGEVVLSEAAIEYVAGQVSVERSFQTQLKGVSTAANLYVIKGFQPDGPTPARQPEGKD